MVCQLDSAHTEVGRPIAWRLVVSRWLPISIFKLSDTLKRYFWRWWWYTLPGCKPDVSEPILCYKASLNNPTRTRAHTDRRGSAEACLGLHFIFGVRGKWPWLFHSRLNECFYGWMSLGPWANEAACVCRAIPRTRWERQLTGYPLGGRTMPAAQCIYAAWPVRSRATDPGAGF